MASFLASPVVAAVLGLGFGVLLVYSSKWSFKLVNPETAQIGLAGAVVALILRMAIAAGVMFVYLAYFRPGFVAFAAATLMGFFAIYTVELVRYRRLRGSGRTRPEGK